MKPQARGKSPVFRDQYLKGGNQLATHYCPGCGHGQLQKMIADAIQEYGIQDETVFISPVGCSVFGYAYFDTGNVQPAHGRPPAVSTGVKHVNEDAIVICYQGDGDLASIGLAEILHAAKRNENMTVIYVNNCIYGMTGGQAAPTSIPGMKTTTTPYGVAEDYEGLPLGICEIMSQIPGPVYVERVALTRTGMVKTKNAIKKAIKAQIDKKGFSLVEVLSPCPVQWRMSPVDARQYINEVITQYFPVKNFVDKIKTAKPKTGKCVDLDELVELLTPKTITVDTKSTPKNSYELPQKILVAGQGGQGNMLLADLITYAAHAEGRYSGGLPSYGPESRSGTANKSSVISEKPIGSSYVSEPDILIAMSPAALNKFLEKVPEGGLVLYNSSVIPGEIKKDGVKIMGINATEIAQSIGKPLYANMVMLGAFMEETNLVSDTAIEAILKQKLGDSPVFNDDIACIAKGREAVKPAEKE